MIDKDKVRIVRSKKKRSERSKKGIARDSNDNDEQQSEVKVTNDQRGGE